MSTVLTDDSVQFGCQVDDFPVSDGCVVTALNVWIHRPGDHWAYKVWINDITTPVLVRTKAQLEYEFPGLFDAVVVPMMSQDLRRVRQTW